jgi:plastocyanin
MNTLTPFFTIRIYIQKSGHFGCRHEHFSFLTALWETMISHFRVIFSSACLILLVLACSFSGCTSNQSPATTTPTTLTPVAELNTIMIKNFAFSPATLTIKTGTTVTWMNQDGVPHQIASDPGSVVAFTSESLENGASYQFTFNQTGTYAYHCTIHPPMKGTIIVQN